MDRYLKSEDWKQVLIAIVVGALAGLASFYVSTQTKLAVLSTKIQRLEKDLDEIKNEKKELEDKIAEISEKVSLLDFRVASVKPENADVSKSIEPTGPKTSIPLSDVLGTTP